MRKPVHRYEDTAANWSADNPKLPAGWEGVESDTGRYKCGDGATAWNSFGYAGAGLILLSSTTINLLVGTKQTFFTVPSGKYCMPLSAVLRNETADLGSTSSALSLGFDGGATNAQLGFSLGDLRNLDGTGQRFLVHSNMAPPGFDAAAISRGVAGSVFGCVVTDPDTDGTAVIDVFGYYTNA